MTSLLKFYSKHEEFRVSEKYVDVTIRCDGQYFKCHRNILAAACDFFDAMFSGDFKEGSEEAVVLSEVSAEIFKDILLYMYTGQIVIDSSNIYELLQASEFFGLPDIENKCSEFVQENRMSVDNTLSIFAFACATKKKFVEILCDDIVKQFRIFSRSSKFLELSFDDLGYILDHWKSSSSSSSHNYELCFNTVIRWVFHHPENRFQHIDYFLKLFHYEDLKSQYVKFMFKQMLTITSESNSVMLSRIFKTAVSYDNVPELRRETLEFSEELLHVYVKDVQENLMRIFSIDNKEQCTITGQIPLTGSNHWIRTLALYDSYLYSLRSEVHDESSTQLFHLQRSADMNSPLSLTSPPVLFDRICWASIRNNIYVYNQKLSERRARENVPSMAFTDEEIRRGIYAYNSDLDCWFPVPWMTLMSKNANLVAHDNRLYLIGVIKLSKQRFVQAYDDRIGKWEKLPETIYWHTSGACCVFQEKIYVCGGGGGGVSRYDPKAAKWEDMGKFVSGMPMNDHQTVSYSNKIWIIGGTVSNDSAGNFVPDNELHAHFCSYDSNKSQTWQSSSLLTDTALSTINTTAGVIMDCVVFTSF